MKPTPGEWTATESAVHATVKGDKGYKLVAVVYGDDPNCKEDERMAANAKLLGAAKKMKSLLKALVERYRGDAGDNCAVADEAEALIKEIES